MPVDTFKTDYNKFLLKKHNFLTNTARDTWFVPFKAFAEMSAITNDYKSRICQLAPSSTAHILQVAGSHHLNVTVHFSKPLKNRVRSALYTPHVSYPVQASPCYLFISILLTRMKC